MPDGVVGQYEIISKEALATVDSIDIKINTVVTSFKLLIKTVTELSTAITGLKSQEEINKIYAETNKLNKETIKLESDLEKLQIKKDEEIRKLKESIDKKNKAEKEAEELRKKTIEDGKKESGTIETLLKRNKELYQERRKLNLETKEGQVRLKAINKEMESNHKLVTKTWTETGKLRYNFNETIKSWIKGGLALAGISIGFQTLKTGFLSVVNSVQSTADAFQVFTGGLKEGLGSLFRSMATGETSFKQLIQNFRDARAAGEEYARILDDIEDRTNQYQIKEANLKKVLTDLEVIAKARNKTDLERKNAIDEIIKKETELQEGRVILAQAVYDNELKLAESQSDLAGAEIIDYLSNYDKKEERIKQLQSFLKEYYDGTSKLSLDQQETLLNEAFSLQVISDGVNKLTDDVRKNLTKAYVDLKNEEVSAIQNNMRLLSMRSGLIEQIEKDSKEISDIKRVELLETEAIKAKEVEIIKAGNEEIMQDIRTKATEKDALTDDEIANAERLNNRMKDIREQTAQESVQLLTDTLNFASSMYDREAELVNRKYEKEINAAQKAGQDTTLIEKKRAREIAEIQRKQAILQKTQSLVQIAANTAMAVSRIWADVPKVDFGIWTGVLTGLAIAAGVAQAGIVLAQPLPEIPAFFKGKKKDSYSGLGVIGDAPGGSSTELLKLPDKRNILFNRPTLIDMPAGSEIVPQRMLQRELSEMAMNGENIINLQSGLTEKSFEKHMNKMVDEIRSVKDGTYISMTENSFRIHARKGHNLTEYRNREFRHKQ